MKAIVITMKNQIYTVDVTDPLHKTARPILGGLIEHVNPMRLKRPYCMLVNESGLLLDLDLNTIGSWLYGTDRHGQPIVGNVMIMKDGRNEYGEGDIFGLDDQEPGSC